MNIDINSPPFAEIEKGLVQKTADRQLLRLKKVFIGVDPLDSNLLSSMLASLSTPMRSIYIGQLYFEALKKWSNNLDSKVLNPAIAESQRLQKEIFEENESSSLTSYREKDINRIAHMAAHGELNNALLKILVEFRAEVFQKLYLDILKEQSKRVFTEKSQLLEVPRVDVAVIPSNTTPMTTGENQASKTA